MAKPPRKAACERCGATVALDPLGWLWYTEADLSCGGQAVECECGADVFVFVGEPSLRASAAEYFTGVTH